MKTIAIIPARSGSKGLPGKNLMPLAGRSILAWTARAASQAIGSENVYVSSDGEDILKEAERIGVGLHRRSAQTSSDTASSESALLEALDDLQQQGVQADRLLFLQCTSPCVLAEDLKGLLDLHEKASLDSAFTATESHAFIWKQAGDGTAVGVNHDPRHRLRRQDREPEYRENGAGYVMSIAGFRQASHRFFGRCGLYEMPVLRSLEIDSQEDARVCEAILLDQNRYT